MEKLEQVRGGDGQPFWRQQLPVLSIGLVDVFAIGFGMGVPIFAIAFGFFVGWLIARRRIRDRKPGDGVTRADLRALLGGAIAIAGLSLTVLLLVWAPAVPNALDRSFDAAAWGIPLILYTSQASMIGWLVLMIVISPALQFMAVVVAGVLTLALTRHTRDEALMRSTG